jgi:hypothetical protein
MSLSNIKNPSYSILKSLGDNIIKDTEFTELEKCLQCDKDILSLNFEAFTVLSLRTCILQGMYQKKFSAYMSK